MNTLEHNKALIEIVNELKNQLSSNTKSIFENVCTVASKNVCQERVKTSFRHEELKIIGYCVEEATCFAITNSALVESMLSEILGEKYKSYIDGTMLNSTVTTLILKMLLMLIILKSNLSELVENNLFLRSKILNPKNKNDEITAETLEQLLEKYELLDKPIKNAEYLKELKNELVKKGRKDVEKQVELGARKPLSFCEVVSKAIDLPVEFFQDTEVVSKLSNPYDDFFNLIPKLLYNADSLASLKCTNERDNKAIDDILNIIAKRNEDAKNKHISIKAKHLNEAVKNY